MLFVSRLRRAPSAVAPLPSSPSRAAARLERWAYIAAIAASWGWASLYPGAKVVLAEVEPLHVAWARAAVAGLALALLTGIRLGGLRPGLARLVSETRAQPFSLIVFGTMTFAGTSVLAMAAQSFLSASVNTLLNNTAPLWLAIGAVALGRAARPGQLVGGSLLALTGVALVVLGPGADLNAGSWWQSLATADPRGITLALTGSMLIAASQIVGRRVLPGHDALAITSLACIWATLVLTPVVVLYTDGFAVFFQASPLTQVVLVYLGLGSTAFNFALWFFALGRLPVTRIAHLQYLIPPLGVALGVIILDEPLTLGLILGGAAILGGMVVAQRGAEPLPVAAGCGSTAAEEPSANPPLAASSR